MFRPRSGISQAAPLPPLMPNENQNAFMPNENQNEGIICRRRSLQYRNESIKRFVMCRSRLCCIMTTPAVRLWSFVLLVQTDLPRVDWTSRVTTCWVFSRREYTKGTVRESDFVANNSDIHRERERPPSCDFGAILVEHNLRIYWLRFWYKDYPG